MPAASFSREKLVDKGFNPKPRNPNPDITPVQVAICLDSFGYDSLRRASAAT